MITAQEARTQTNKMHKDLVNAELTMVMSEIEAAMRKGEYSCWVKESQISSRVIMYLKELGYKITSSTQYNETEYKISW